MRDVPLRMSRPLHSESTTLYWGVEDGKLQMEYFTMSDIYCTYCVKLDYDDICAIYNFLNDWGSESVEIIQPYSSTVNGKPMWCMFKLEYAENPKATRSVQRMYFYAQCWGKDLKESLEEDMILSWTSWDDYFFWEEFESFRAYISNMKKLLDRMTELRE